MEYLCWFSSIIITWIPEYYPSIILSSFTSMFSNTINEFVNSKESYDIIRSFKIKNVLWKKRDEERTYSTGLTGSNNFEEESKEDESLLTGEEYEEDFETETETGDGESISS